MMTKTRWLIAFVLAGCASSAPTDNTLDPADGKADGTSGTYFECKYLGTGTTTWLEVRKRSVVVTFEGTGANTGAKTGSDASSKTYGNWQSDVMFGSGDTLVIPDSMITSGSGTVVWNVANVNPTWQGQCTKKQPTGDQCMPLVELISPIDSSAIPQYAKVSTGHYTVTVASSRVGDFVYDVAMKVDGILCVQDTIMPVSCSAIVADAIGTQAVNDGSTAGQPYVQKRTATATGYTWEGGVHDPESGDFAYTVTTDSADDGCQVGAVTTAP